MHKSCVLALLTNALQSSIKQLLFGNFKKSIICFPWPSTWCFILEVNYNDVTSLATCGDNHHTLEHSQDNQVFVTRMPRIWKCDDGVGWFNTT
jgi:hypothetical protein